MEKGVQRWVVDISRWNPSSPDFSFTLSLLPPHEHPSITRFCHLEDRKRALVSRLLQYALVHQVLDIPFQDILINRTLEGKPYLDCGNLSVQFPNFNFNVSHHGDYVAIVSEPLCIVGVDIVRYEHPPKLNIQEFVQGFRSLFSVLEFDKIRNAGTCQDTLIEFYRYWSLKEAYAKAIGSGLSDGLDKVEFHHIDWSNINAKVDGRFEKNWRFWSFELGRGHWVSVARGHPRLATETYKRCLSRVDFDEMEYFAGLDFPNLDFVLKRVVDLMPISHEATQLQDRV